MASGRNGTIYIGSTSNLVQRVYQHREGLIEGFTKDKKCKTLVWFEAHDTIEGARHRELQMKEWQRRWKLREIEGVQPRLERSFSDVDVTLDPGLRRGTRR